MSSDNLPDLHMLNVVVRDMAASLNLSAAGSAHVQLKMPGGFSLELDTAEPDRGRLPRPFDAFWGARYAIVADPDGNDVGLMSPVGIPPDMAAGAIPGP